MFLLLLRRLFFIPVSLSPTHSIPLLMDAAAAAAKAFLSSFASSKVGCYFFAGSLSAYQNVGRSRYLICLKSIVHSMCVTVIKEPTPTSADKIIYICIYLCIYGCNEMGDEKVEELNRELGQMGPDARSLQFPIQLLTYL